LGDRLRVTLVLATANTDKAREIVEILTGIAALDVEVVPRPPNVPEVDETGSTLEENARLKAVAVSQATGMPAIADDTGLEVDALGGLPGVRSARFAGEDATYADNVAKLLDELAGVGRARRTARFATAAIVRFPDGREVSALGTVDGTIAPAPRGEEGFGYDPVFVPDEGDGRTFAEMSPAEKHELSHRGRAFRTLADGLRAVLAHEGEARTERWQSSTSRDSWPT
jgi:XTP/dITP diphosphohydrolase